MDTLMAHFAARFDQVGRQMGLRAADAGELLAWQAELRARLRAITGIGTLRGCPLDPILGPAVRCDGYTRQHVSIMVEPGLRMPLYALAPDGLAPGERRPVVLCPHGHSGGGKESVAGVRDDPQVAGAIDIYHYDYGVQLARAGVVALCPDARGFGERRELSAQAETGPLGGSCRVINNMAIPLGQTLTGMWVWDLMRLADYAATRADCDIGRLGCAGLSGGGHQAIWLAALDERVRATVVSGYFYGYRDALLVLNQNCSCNYVPGLWLLADMGDLGALVAPRPLFIESGTDDDLNGPSGIANVRGQIAIARRAYALLGAEAAVDEQAFEGGHRWHGERALPWLLAQLG